ncbi:MAG: hemolysin family protein [Myxococcota bacterium]
MAGLLLLTVFLVFANGFFVAAEFALVKVRPTQLDVAEAEERAMAGVAKNIVHHLDSYLSATQLGITLTSLGLGWIGEPAVAALLEPAFHSLGLPDDLLHQVSFIVGFSIISFLHIVLGEVAPKSLAIARPVSTTLAVSWPMRVFHTVTYPALVVLSASSNLLLRLFGVEPANTHALAVDSDEFVRMAAQSAEAGHISTQEGEMVSKVFAFSARVAEEIMVPRHQVQGLDLEDELMPQLQEAMRRGHSRYPVYEGNLDRPLGILHLKDLLNQDWSKLDAAGLQARMRPLLLVPGTLAAEKVMRRMQRRRTHLALVVDERGTVAGLVTLEDALEELVGEIHDEYDQEDAEIETLGDGTYAFSGAVLLDEVVEILQVAEPESRAHTLQGWLMEELERLPESGDVVNLGHWSLRIAGLEGRTVRRVEASRTTPGSTPESDASESA